MQNKFLLKYQNSIFTTIILVGIIFFIEIIEFLNRLGYFMGSYGIELLKNIYMDFIDSFIHLLFYIFGLEYFIFNVKKEKIFALMPLLVSVLFLIFFSLFNVYDNYIAGKINLFFNQYKKVVEFAKQEKFQLIESFSDFPNEKNFKKYGEITNQIYKLSNPYKYLTSDNAFKSTIEVLKSKKIGLFQIRFPLNGTKYSLIYTAEDKIFTSDSTYSHIKKIKPNWYYVIWN